MKNDVIRLLEQYRLLLIDRDTFSNQMCILE